jgi:hypothetical protein
VGIFMPNINKIIRESFDITFNVYEIDQEGRKNKRKWYAYLLDFPFKANNPIGFYYFSVALSIANFIVIFPLKLCSKAIELALRIGENIFKSLNEETAHPVFKLIFNILHHFTGMLASLVRYTCSLKLIEAADECAEENSRAMQVLNWLLPTALAKKIAPGLAARLGYALSFSGIVGLAYLTLGFVPILNAFSISPHILTGTIVFVSYLQAVVSKALSEFLSPPSYHSLIAQRDQLYKEIKVKCERLGKICHAPFWMKINKLNIDIKKAKQKAYEAFKKLGMDTAKKEKSEKFLLEFAILAKQLEDEDLITNSEFLFTIFYDTQSLIAQPENFHNRTLENLMALSRLLDNKAAEGTEIMRQFNIKKDKYNLAIRDFKIFKADNEVNLNSLLVFEKPMKEAKETKEAKSPATRVSTPISAFPSQTLFGSAPRVQNNAHRLTSREDKRIKMLQAAEKRLMSLNPK